MTGDHVGQCGAGPEGLSTETYPSITKVSGAPGPGISKILSNWRALR